MDRACGEFVAKMEDVLEVYSLPYDPGIPMICIDEQPVQLLGEKLRPIPMKPGNPRKVEILAGCIKNEIKGGKIGS